MDIGRRGLKVMGQASVVDPTSTYDTVSFSGCRMMLLKLWSFKNLLGLIFVIGEQNSDGL